MWSDEVLTWWTNLSMCWGAFKYIEKSPWNYVCVMCPSIDTQIFCGGKGAFKYKERKKNLWSASWLHDAAPHLCISIIHSKPTMSQVAMNHKLSYQSWNLSCKPSYFSLCNQLCIISKNVSGHYVNRQLGKVPWWLGCMNVHGLSFLC